MKRPNITPREWTACSGHAGEKYNIETRGRDNDCEPVATLIGPDRRANARAIASVPKLLAALEHVVEPIGHYIGKGKYPRVSISVSAFEQMKAALIEAGYTFD